jgi:hypothetical protein
MGEREEVEALAGVLDDHRRGDSEKRCLEGMGWVWATDCFCDWEGRDRDHPQHVAEAILASPAMRDLLAEERAKALREAADVIDAKSEHEGGMYAGDCSDLVRRLAGDA